MKVLSYRFACFIIGLIFSLNLLAQSPEDFHPPSLDKKDSYTVKLKSDKDYPDMRTAYIEGELEDGSIQLLVEGFDILQPVILSVVPDNPDNPIDVQLLKDNWDNVVQEESNIRNVYETQFRTHKKFGIRIKSSTPDAKFHLATFVGQALKLKSDAFFYPITNPDKSKKIMPAEESNKTHQSSNENENEKSNFFTSNNFLLILLLFIILLVSILLFKKNKNPKILLILFFFMGTHAANAGIRSISGGDWQALHKVLGYKINPITSVKSAYDFFNKLNTAVGKYKPLSSSDAQQMPEMDVRDIPSLPSSCYSASTNVGSVISSGQDNSLPGESIEETNSREGCACLKNAYNDFYNNYFTLERLRIIYTTTMQDANDAISFGDSFSKVHALTGLAWQDEKVRIKKSIKGLKGSYDNKYRELTDETYNVLKEIEQCERMFGNNDWYRQSGFMYFQFVKLRYKRMD